MDRAGVSDGLVSVRFIPACNCGEEERTLIRGVFESHPLCPLVS